MRNIPEKIAAIFHLFILLSFQKIRKVTRMRMTEEQQEIREVGSQAVKNKENLAVIAFAGAGKTTTLKGLAEAISSRGCYLAFNKSIADEAKRKLIRTRCTASTMHSLAYGTIRDIISSPTNLNAKDFRNTGILGKFHVPRIAGWNDFRVSGAVCRAVTNYCNSADEEITLDHARDSIIQSVGDPDFLNSLEKVEKAEMAINRLSGPIMEMARMYWRDSIENSRFSHDAYLKLLDLDADLRSMAFSSFRYLMIDEAQDTNPVQLSILRKSGIPLIAVGDPYQQIYSWRGAENALDQIEGRRLFLTQSFRFGEDIAETAREILASRPDGGPSQRLIGAGRGLSADYAGPRVAVICRTNVGMVDEAMRIMKAGKKVHIDNVEALVADVRSAEALQCGDMPRVTSPDIRQFDSWFELVSEAEESGGSLARIVQIVEENRVSQIEDLMRAQTAGKNAEVMICTAHRSKGLEFPGVFLGGDWKTVDTMQKRYKGAQRDSAKHVTLAVEEWNALYVAATRPIVRLQGLDRIMEPLREAEAELVDPGT